MIRQFGWIDVFYLAAALRWTLALTAVAFVGGGIVGVIVALLRVGRFVPLQLLGTAYTQVVQGTPLLVWLFGLYFGLAIVGFSVAPWVAAAAAFSIYAGAFLGEIWRNGDLDMLTRKYLDRPFEMLPTL